MSTQQQLFAAIEAGQTRTVRLLLSTNSTLVNARNASGLSAVLVTTYNGKNDTHKRRADGRSSIDHQSGVE